MYRAFGHRTRHAFVPTASATTAPPCRHTAPLGLSPWWAAVALTASILAAPAWAKDNGPIRAAQKWTAEEVQMLPKYCQARMWHNTPEAEKYWTSVMGPTYQHIHHYCRGLVHTNRGTMLFRDPVERKRALNFSIPEFDYVLRHAPKDFVLLPELYTKRGGNLIRLGRTEEGMQDLRRAMELKSDYWPPYAVMSDYYRDAGNPAKAKEWLDKALSVAPNAKALQLRVSELRAGRRSSAPSDPEPAAELDKSASAEEPSPASKEPVK